MRLAALRQLDIHVVVVGEHDQSAFDREIGDTEVLIHILQPVTAATIEKAPRLRLIQKVGVGVDTIDRAAASRHSVLVANMPGTNSQAVAEHTLALMFATLRRTVTLHQETVALNGWSLPPDFFENVGEISGRTVGLVGYGTIPQRLTPVIEALGADWIYHSRTVGAGPADRYRRLDDLLAQSDIVSLHIPLSDETRQLFGATLFALMRPGALLINTARGELIDEEALAAALSSGHLRGAGLDVAAQEPMASDNPLRQLPNVTFSPHVAWLTPETLDRSLAVLIENCTRLSRGDPLINVVPWVEQIQ